MSSLIGIEGDRWSLPRATDALADAARQAGRPGLVWIVGLFYPSVTLGLNQAWKVFTAEGVKVPPEHSWFGQGLPGGRMPILAADLLLAAGFTLCLGIAFFPLFRLVGGLARIAPPELWREACAERRVPSIGALWAAGKGMTLSVMGLWIQLIVMVVGALVLILLPAELAARPFLTADSSTSAGPFKFVLGALVLGPIVLFFLSYSLAISVLSQLALQSLAHNRRGVGSALLHGWRIMRHDIWATARAVLVDLVLSLSVLALWRLFSGLVPLDLVSNCILAVLSGFAGVARAGYWARAYRALGGLSPDDGVPGLTRA